MYVFGKALQEVVPTPAALLGTGTPSFGCGLLLLLLLLLLYHTSSSENWSKFVVLSVYDIRSSERCVYYSAAVTVPWHRSSSLSDSAFRAALASVSFIPVAAGAAVEATSTFVIAAVNAVGTVNRLCGEKQKGVGLRREKVEAESTRLTYHKFGTVHAVNKSGVKRPMESSLKPELNRGARIYRRP